MTFPLLGRDTIYLYFDIVIQVVIGVSVAIQPDIPCLYTFCIDQFTLRGFNIVHVFTCSKTGGVVVVIVEEGRDPFLEFRIVRNLQEWQLASGCV